MPQQSSTGAQSYPCTHQLPTEKAFEDCANKKDLMTFKQNIALWVKSKQQRNCGSEKKSESENSNKEDCRKKHKKRKLD